MSGWDKEKLVAAFYRACPGITAEEIEQRIAAHVARTGDDIEVRVPNVTEPAETFLFINEDGTVSRRSK
jgi:hypothetical protein